MDIWPVLAGNPQTPPRDQFFYFRGLNLEAVRSGPWKLHLSLADGVAGERKGKARPRSFHLGDDLGETKDVAAEEPAVVARLQSLADSMRSDLGTEGIGPGCRPLGRVAQPQPLIGSDGTVRANAIATIKQFP